MKIPRITAMLTALALLAVLAATPALAGYACQKADEYGGHSTYWNVACFWDWFMDLPMI